MIHINQPRLDRVRAHTAPDRLREIDGRIRRTVRHYATRSNDEISGRIDQLNREWDLERWLEAHASLLALGGILLGATVDRKWLILPGAVAAFLLQQAVQGWSPPLPLFRRYGVRTRFEIERERYALKALRGDFESVSVRETDPFKLTNRVMSAVCEE